MFLGIDAGGTKTQLCVIDAKERIITEATYDGCHLSRDSTAPIKRYITQLLEDAKMSVTDLRSITLGIAGWDESPYQDDHRNELSQFHIGPEYSIVSDAFLGLTRFSRSGPVIAITAGTGSVLFGLTDDQQPFRLGGHGCYFGDQGSGYDIAQKAIAHALLSLDRGEITPIYKAAHRYFETESLNQLLQQQQKVKKVAGFAEEVLHLASAGDHEASQIIHNAANDLHQLVKNAIHRDLIPNTGFKVGLHGGCLSNNTCLKTLLVDALTEAHEAEFLSPQYSAAFAAALHSKSQAL